MSLPDQAPAKAITLLERERDALKAEKQLLEADNGNMKKELSSFRRIYWADVVFKGIILIILAVLAYIIFSYFKILFSYQRTIIDMLRQLQEQSGEFPVL